MQPRAAAWQALAAELSRLLGTRCRSEPERSVHGGSINECYLWQSDGGPLFVKVASREEWPMLEAEAQGLTELEAARALRVPHVLAMGSNVRHAFLALEWIDVGGGAGGDSERKLGERLAAQHRVTAPQFGWHRDNTIGRTPQVNTWAGDWLVFFRERRLRHQLELAVRNGYGKQLEEVGGRLLESLPHLLRSRGDVQPSLLHGDLWGGNWLVDTQGEPVIFDPAVYYGDREADLAMTRLFGGFGREFYRAYEEALPLAPGAEQRVGLYNLYHVLNHANLFGGGYVQQARGMMDRLLAET